MFNQFNLFSKCFYVVYITSIEILAKVVFLMTLILKTDKYHNYQELSARTVLTDKKQCY